VATGLVPRRHGIVGYQMWFEGISPPVNVLRWTSPWGDPIEADYAAVLPAPNLWERLSAGGVEPITVQPGHFADSPLSRMLYRGCRLEPAWSAQDLIDATLDLASKPRRFVLTYVPHVDVAAHTSGQSSNEYDDAMRVVGRIWDQLAARLPGGSALLGTADHGHVDYVGDAVVEVKEPSEVGFAGEPRALYARGPSEALETLDSLPATLVGGDELLSLWGPEGEDHPRLPDRTPDLCLLANTGKALLVPSVGFRWIGFHGGLEPEEREVPLLVA
ncbi:MAG: alkaline phosphatase family protein, partial [Acidimicrobiia bacterium]